MKDLPLTKGAVAILDDEDKELVLRACGSWYFDGRYAKATKWNKKEKKYDRLYLHRVIMNAPKGMDVDHINGDKLDNRRENLRICTRSDNINNKPSSRPNTSGHRGVFKEKKSSRWLAYITVRGRLVRLGTWDTFEEAVAVRKAVADIFYPIGDFTN